MSNNGTSSGWKIYYVPEQEIKGIVALFGWTGASRRHVEKHAQMFHSKGFATVVGIADNFTLMFRRTVQVNAFVEEFVVRTANLIRTLEQKMERSKKFSEIPLVLYAFSNGGCFPLQRLNELMLKDNYANSNSNNNNDNKNKSEETIPILEKTSLVNDLQLLQNRIKGQIFDSSPCYLSLSSVLNAVKAALDNPIIFYGLFAPSFVVFFYLKHWIGHLLLKQPDEIIKFWDHFATDNPCYDQAYVYSTNDKITDSNRIDELIAIRKEHACPSTSSIIRTKKFVDSDHVEHYRKHPDEYKTFLYNFLDTILHK